MKRKLLFLLCAMLTSVGMWAVEFTETYTLTGKGKDDWTTLLKNVVGDLRTFEVSVNGTNGHLMVWGGTTDPSGVHYGDNWRDMAFRNVSKGNKIAITISDATKLSQVTLNSNLDKVSYEDVGATRTFTVTGDELSVLNFARATDNICVTQIQYTYQMPAGFTKVTNVADLNATNFANNYYVITAETNPGLVLAYNTTRGGDGNTDLYYTSQDVSNNLYQLWRLEYNDGDPSGFSMRNVKKDNLLLQTESYGSYPIRLHDQNNPCEWTKIVPASDSNDGFTFEWGYYSNLNDRFFGLWTPTNDYFSGEYLAGNKNTDEQKGHFNIYAISRATFNALYAATHEDITDLMLNPVVANSIGWSGSYLNSGQQYTGAPDNTYFDRNNAEMNTRQAITLPAGDYVVKAASRASTSQGDAWLYAYPEGGSADIDRYNINKKGNSGNVLGNGWDWTMMAFTLAEETTMNIGFFMAKSSWASVDDWHLYKVNGTTPADVIDAFSAKLSYMEDEKQYSSVRTAAEGAVSTLKSTWSIDNFKDARTKVTAAETSVKTYANLKAAIDKANDVFDKNNFVTADATTAFQDEIGKATTGWTNGTYSDDQANEEITTLGTAVSGVHANASGAAGVYMTSTWSKTNENWWNAPYINTWSTEGDNDGTGFSVPFFEYFADENQDLGANTFTATLSGLDNGFYEMEIWARVQRRSDADFNVDESMITMSVNGGEEVSIMSGQTTVGSGTSVMRLGRYTARGMVTDGTLSLSINVKDKSKVHWLSWRDVSYTKLADYEVELASSETLEGWKSFYNAYSNYEVDEKTTIYKAAAPSANASTITLTPVKGNIVPKQTPVILKTSAVNYKMTLTATTTASEDDFTGNALTYKAEEGAVSRAYVLGYLPGGGNGLGFYSYTVSLPAGTIYVTVPSEAKSLRIVVDGQTTDVVAPEVAEAEEEEEVLVNLAGIPVGKDYKGIVINQKGEKRYQK